jgi:hypothetical protein
LVARRDGPGGLADAHHTGDRRQHQDRVADGYERDEDHSLGEDIARFSRCLQGDARLAHPARSTQREEGDVVLTEEGDHVTDLALTPDDGGALLRQAVGMVGRRGGSHGLFRRLCVHVSGYIIARAAGYAKGSTRPCGVGGSDLGAMFPEPQPAAGPDRSRPARTVPR